MKKDQRQTWPNVLRFLLFQVGILYTAIPFAQTPLSFNHLSRSDGLSNPFNSYIYQDSRGFVWISSVDGLNRFDGENIKVYRPDPTSEYALSGNIISSNFFEDKHGNLWFTSYGALHVYYRVRDHFESIQLTNTSGEYLTEDYHAFHYSSDGTIWVRTGLGNNGIVHRYNTTDRSDEIVSPIDGQRNYLVISSKGEERYLLSSMLGKPGIELIDLQDSIREVQHFLEGSPGRGSSLKTYNTYPLSSDTIFIGTEKGFAIFSYERRHLDLYPVYKKQELGAVWSVFPLDKTNVLVSTENLGILLFDLISREFTMQYAPIPDDEFSLRSADIREIYVDQSKTLWASIWGKGVEYASFNKNNFPLVSFDQFGSQVEMREIFQRNDHEVWCNLVSDGVAILDSSGAINRHFRAPRLSSYSGGRIENLLLDRSDRLWMLVSYENNTKRVLFSQKKEEMHWNEVALMPDAVSSVSTPLYQLSDDRILFCSGRGIWEILSNGDGISIIPCPELVNYQDLPFYKIYEDRLGQVYFTANYDRVLIFRLEQDKLSYRQNLTEIGDVKGFCEGVQDSVLWLATSSGLFQVNKFNFKYDLLSSKNSELTNESILAVLEDKEENLWLKTQNELWKYHPGKNEIRKYQLSNGIQENLTTRIPVLHSSWGEFWLGGPRGLTIFRPEKIHDFPVQATVQITNILSNGEKLMTDTFVGELERLVLPYSDNTLSFDFVSCEYSDPSSIRFRYRMQHFDQTWVDGGNLGFARYANLPAGRFVFEVQVANADGIWSERSKMLALQILPPWYQTWWARSLFILFGFLLLFIFYRWRTSVHRRKLQIQEIELDRERKLNERLRQVDQLKDQFLANTSHELRTPLIGIIGLAESLRDGATGALPETTKQNLDLITASGKRLSHLIDDVLDFSRIRNSDLELDKTLIDLFSVADLVCTLLKPSIRLKNVTLINAVPTDLPLVLADENRLQQILFNLLGNAIKFTDSGKIEVTAVKSEESISVSVSDTGIGIAKDKLEQIFIGFEQADGSSRRQYGGAGLGLTITKQLVELHGGEIEVQSEPGEGSVFTFTLPNTTTLEVSGPAASASQKNIRDFNLMETVEEKYDAAPDHPVRSVGRILVVDDELV
ncbi:MAG: hypothetical protein KDC80_00590, partial [Saprospiraceae bacterium]|nr:hypothetical protein [Saprospiraceae bacterium]